MLTIRLQRGGKKNNPQYKVVLAEKTAANQKQFVEVLGSYNPHNKELVIKSNDRLNYWMNDQHVELSPTVHNLFVTKDLVKADKKRAFAIPAKPEEAKAEEPSVAEGAETASAEATDAPAAEEAPSEEPAAPAETEAPAETPAKEPKSESQE